MRTISYRNAVVANQLLYALFPMAARAVIRPNLGLIDYLKVSLLNLRDIRFLDRRRLRGTFFWCFDDWSHGYFHWMFDVLPKLFALIDEHGRLDLLVPQEVIAGGYVESTCTDLGLRIVPLKRRVFYRIDAVHCCPNYRYYDTRSLARIRDHFLDAYGLEKRSRGARNIYVSRARAARRRVLNEDALQGALAHHGFEIVHLEDLAFEDQVKLFSQAAIVVGLHGAGLSNLVFSPRTTKVCEMRSAGFANDVFEKLAGALGMGYTTMEMPSDQTEMLMTDFTVDPVAFERTLLGLTDGDAVDPGA